MKSTNYNAYRNRDDCPSNSESNYDGSGEEDYDYESDDTVDNASYGYFNYQSSLNHKYWTYPDSRIESKMILKNSTLSLNSFSNFNYGLSLSTTNQIDSTFNGYTYLDSRNRKFSSENYAFNKNEAYSNASEGSSYDNSPNEFQINVKSTYSFTSRNHDQDLYFIKLDHMKNLITVNQDSENNYICFSENNKIFKISISKETGDYLFEVSS